MQRSAMITITHMSIRRTAIAAAFLLASSPLAAQTVPGKPDPARGATLAEKLCSNCHVATATKDRPVKADVPTFQEIAKREGRTDAWIAGKIILPAHPMPTFNLSRSDIGDLVAFITSLNKDK